MATRLPKWDDCPGCAKTGIVSTVDPALGVLTETGFVRVVCSEGHVLRFRRSLANAWHRVEDRRPSRPATRKPAAW